MKTHHAPRFVNPLVLRSLISLLCAGCATDFRESHFFKSGGENEFGPTVNYYRVNVKGSTLISSSRYVSGYFDPEAVDIYFNEIHQPANAAIRPANKPKDGAGEGGEGDEEQTESGAEPARPVAPSLEGKDLVLILSTNSEEVANQIGALASNQQFTTALAGLAARKDFADAADAEYRLRSSKARAKDLATLGQQTIGGLAADAGRPDAERAAMIVINRLAYDLGSVTSFQTLDEAATWFDRNRGKIDEGGVR